MKAPRCTIILPTHNRAATLPRAVASAIAQNEPDFELIIIDDGSTDNTRAWLATLNDPRIRVVLLEHNQGPSAARNIGINMAAAPVLAFLDSDDSYCEERLSVPLAVFDRNPDVICVLSSARKEYKRGNTTVALLPDVKLASPAFEWAMICDLVGVECTSITVRTEDARKVGGFCPELRRTEDREFLVRLSRLGAARIVPDVLWEKTWSIDGLSNQWATAGRDLVSYFNQRTEYLGRYRKVGQYLATKILIMHIRHSDIASLVSDARRFYRMGLLDRDIARLCRSHLQVKRYRRMAQHQPLEALTGPPTDWE
ncbi:MAG TPA: glycosyltransferase family 2 protein [Pseudolabrys sp.]|nr:glycosyltransferase family 2 protein [Pseudolabrys sp.]